MREREMAAVAAAFRQERTLKRTLFMEKKRMMGERDENIERQLSILNRQMKELAYVYHIVAGRSGISDNEFWVWYALLVFEGELSQQDICDSWSLPKQTVNSIIGNLVKNGFVFLEAAPGFRNRKNIRLSERGRKYGESIVRRVYEAEHNTLRKMTDQERQDFIGLFEKYITLLKEEIHEE